MPLTRNLTQPLTRAITNAITQAGAGGGFYAPPPVALRDLVLAGGVTPSAPLVAIGDSHTDDLGAAQYMWDKLQGVCGKPNRGLEGVDPAAIVPMGINGMTLQSYLPYSGTNKYPDVVALNPSVIVACWLTNDVRQGGLGLTVSAIRDAGAARLNALVAQIKADLPSTLIVLRIPAPYLTINSPAHNYITDGTNVNPAGLAQIYTSGVRAAHYKVLETHPDVMIYDPQARLFGTTSPTTTNSPLGGYQAYADQIHQGQAGYYAEGVDFAEWVGAAQPYDEVAATAAIASNPYNPWAAYSRILEDETRFVKVAESYAATVTAGNTYLDYGPSSPTADQYKIRGTAVENAAVGNTHRYDIVHLVAAESALFLPNGTSDSVQAANTRFILPGGTTVPATVLAESDIRVYRQIKSGDATLNDAMAAATFLRTGRIGGGATNYLLIDACSLTASVSAPAQNASAWVPDCSAGMRVYVEGVAGYLTLAANFSANASYFQVTGSFGTDYGTLKGRIAIIVNAP